MNKMSYDFHPFVNPTNKGKITLPQKNTIITLNLEQTRETREKEDLIAKYNIDINKLSERITKEEGAVYGISDLKEIAKQLKITNYNKYGKKDLVKFIRSKLGLV